MVPRHNVELDLRCSILVEYSIFSAKQINKILGKKTYLLYTPCSYDIPIHTEHELRDVIESRMPYSDYLRYYLSRFSCDAIISQNKKVTNLRPSKNMTFNLQRLSSTMFGDFAIEHVWRKHSLACTPSRIHLRRADTKSITSAPLNIGSFEFAHLTRY